MPLSKARNKERMKEQMRVKRRMLQPSGEMLQPDWQTNPNRYLEAHLRVYPEYLSELNAGTYDPKLDPYINPLLRGISHLPNCRDGRYR